MEGRKARIAQFGRQNAVTGVYQSSAVCMELQAQMVRPFLYLLGVIAFCGLYQLGGLLVQRSERFAYELALRLEPSETVRKFFQYTGIFIQVVAVGLGALDGVMALLTAF